MSRKIWFIREVHNKIQTNQIFKTLKRCKTPNTIQTKNKNKNFKIKFDLQWIIIQNDFEIVMVMITKIPSYINHFWWNIVTQIFALFSKKPHSWLQESKVPDSTSSRTLMLDMRIFVGSGGTFNGYFWFHS